MSDFVTDLRNGKPVSGTWLSMGDPTVAEIVAGLDFDFVVIDTEHAATTLESVEHVLRAVDAARGNTAALARVPWNDPVRIKRLLETGPSGLLIPMVESAAEARTAVRAMRYPPDGDRGIAAGRASNYTHDFVESVETANERLVTIVQVETRRGLENAAEIASVDGVDALFIGPADLSAALGAFPGTDDPVVVGAVEQIVEAAGAAGVPVGTLAVDSGEIDTWFDRGMDFLVVGFDAAFVAEGAAAALRAYQDAT